MRRFIVIDLETTGNQPDKDEIIQIGAVLVEGNEIKDIYSTFIFTDKEIPIYIQELTGIKPEMLKDAPNLDEVFINLLPLLEGSIFVAHNATFDLEFIQRALDKSGYASFAGLVIDTLDLSRILLPMVQSYKLGQLTEELEISHENPHRADDDALATANLLLKLLNLLEEMPLVYLQRLSEIVNRHQRDLVVLIEEIIIRKHSHYQEEENYATINQIALQYDYVDDMAYQDLNDEEKGKDKFDFESMFNANGLLNNNFPDFELRPAQQEMAKEVMNAFKDNVHLMVEAGTGTGKSLAYLIPSLFWAKEHDEKVVIATHTINLQEQLYQRDIPLLKNILPFAFSAAVLKGRSNYLCLRKFEQQLLINKLDRNNEDAVNIAQMLTWVSQTKTGDIEEINLSSSGRNLWNEVKSDAETCLNRHCPWFRTCFYHRAKNKAQTADLIITNHSLLLTNLKADHRILPFYKRLVIDEAHQFEEVATKHLGFEVNQYNFNFLLQRLYKDAKTGFFVKIINNLMETQGSDQAYIANKIKNNVLPLLTNIEGFLVSYFNLLGEFVDKVVKKGEINQKTLRITDKVKEYPEWGKVQELTENTYIELTEMVNTMEDVLKQLRNLEDVEEGLVVDFNGYLQELKQLMYNFSEWNHANNDKMVFWVETINSKKKYISYLFAAPIDIGPYIKEFLFDKLDSIILTSATLSVNDSFDYACREFGFDPTDENLRKIKLHSPFNYQEQAVVYIPNDVPNIQDVTEQQFIEHLTGNIAETAIYFNGRTLVLFTSHKMLQIAHDKLRKVLEPHQIKVLGHGIDSNSRSKLTKNFSSNTNTILLGTNSFWEGVDIPGDALSALIIVRLPFVPPNHPIQEAKTDKLKQENLNPFMELSVPQAVIRFKQGFGRLIRTKKDRGVVIVFDRRVVEARYGKAFIKSLPAVKVLYQPFDKIFKHMESWINKIE